jgi:hypothetical protein
MKPLDIILDAAKQKTIGPEGISVEELFSSLTVSRTGFNDMLVNLGGEEAIVIICPSGDKTVRYEYSKNLLETLVCPVLLVYGDKTVEYFDVVRDQRGVTYKNFLTKKINNSFFDPQRHKLYFKPGNYNGKRKIIVKAGYKIFVLD